MDQNSPATAKQRKHSFILYKDFAPQLQILSAEQAGHLLKAIYAYQVGEDYDVDDQVVKFALNGIISQFKRDTEKYEVTCSKNRRNVLKRWEKDKNKKMPNDTPVYDRIPSNTKHTDSDSDSDSDSEKEKELKCAEPVPDSPPENSVLCFPCTGAEKSWHLTRPKLAEWEETYDTLDIIAQSRGALQWLKDNPTRKKTARGMPRFLGAWFSRAVARGDTVAKAAPASSSEEKLTYAD